MALFGVICVCVAVVCCSGVLQCVAVCCAVLHCLSECGEVMALMCVCVAVVCCTMCASTMYTSTTHRSGVLHYEGVLHCDTTHRSGVLHYVLQCVVEVYVFVRKWCVALCCTVSMFLR